MKLATLAALLSLAGCMTNLGPVVTDVHMVDDKVHFTRCDLSVPTVPLWAFSGGELENCVNEAGKPVQQGAPIKP